MKQWYQYNEYVVKIFHNNELIRTLTLSLHPEELEEVFRDIVKEKNMTYSYEIKESESERIYG